MDDILKQLLDGAPDAILAADRVGIIRYWNRGAELIFGYTAAEAIGRSLELIIPGNLRDRHWQGYNRVMAGGETKYKTGLLTSPGVTRGGERVSLEFSMVLMHDEGGAIWGCGALMRDVTDRWQREKELQGRLAECQDRLGREAGG